MCLAETYSFGYSLNTTLSLETNLIANAIVSSVKIIFQEGIMKEIIRVLKSKAKENILNFKWVLKV